MNISNSGLLLTNLVWLQLMYLLVLLVLLTQGLQQLVGITTIWWPLCLFLIGNAMHCNNFFIGYLLSRAGCY